MPYLCGAAPGGAKDPGPSRPVYAGPRPGSAPGRSYPSSSDPVGVSLGELSARARVPLEAVALATDGAPYRRSELGWPEMEPGPYRRTGAAGGPIADRGVLRPVVEEAVLRRA